MAVDPNQPQLATQIINPGSAYRGGGALMPGSEYAGLMSPGYQTVYDPSTMASLPSYEKMQGANSAGFNRFRDFALSKGPSSYANAAMRQQNLMAMRGKENLARGIQGQNALAMSNLAAQGGLSSGARERVAETGQNAFTMGSQGIESGNMENALQIGAQDQGQKLNALGALPGMEQARVSGWNDVRSKDVANQMSEIARINAFNESQTRERNAAIGAQKQADAIAAASNNPNKGGLLGMGGIAGTGVRLDSRSPRNFVANLFPGAGSLMNELENYF